MSPQVDASPPMGPVSRPSRLAVLLALGVLFGLCFLNRWTFAKFFSLDYFHWYVNAGPFIGLATAAFGAAWGGLDQNPRLVSANPLFYLRASLLVAGLPINAFGLHLRSKSHKTPVSNWEWLAALPLILVFVVAALGWLVLVVPPQYFLFLVAGSPSRIAMASVVRVEARWVGRNIEFENRSTQDEVRKADGWWDASMRDSPVSLANAFAAAALFLMGLLWKT